MAIPHALAAKYKLKVGAGTALSSTDLKKSARRSPSRSSSRPGSRESVTPPDEPGSGGLPGAIVEKKKKRRKKKAGADGGQGGEPAETALQMAMRSSQGMKGGMSVVRQMSMLQRPGVVPASASASSAVAAAGTRSSPSDPVTAEESETRESNQRKALKELMIKFEHNQRQMAEAQRQLIEGKTSVFSGVSRAKMGLMLLANNLTVLICSFIVFFLVYNLDPLPPGTLTAGGAIQADGLRVVAAPGASEEEQRVKLASAADATLLAIKPGSGAADSRLVLAAEDNMASSFSLSVPRAVSEPDSETGGFALSAGALEAVAFGAGGAVVGKHAGVGNIVSVQADGSVHVLELHDSLIKSHLDLRALPAPGSHLVVKPLGSGRVLVNGRDLKVTDLFQVGPRQTFVSQGGLLADAGKVPTMGVDVRRRTVTVGSIVNPVRYKLDGDSTFYGNLTVNGDLNLQKGTLTLRDMNFGNVRSLSFNKGQRLGGQAADHVHFFGNMEMRDEASRITFAMSARDGSIHTRGEMAACTRLQDPPGDVDLQGSVTMGSNWRDTQLGSVLMKGASTTMHSVTALGSVHIGSANVSTRADIVGGVVARSHTPGLFSQGVDPLVALHPVHRSLVFGANVDVSADVALSSQVTLTHALGNKLDTKGATAIGGSAHVQNAGLSVAGLASLHSHLSGIAMRIEGDVMLGLNETVIEIPRNETYYDVTIDNITTTMTRFADVLARLGNLTYQDHVVERSVPLPPLLNVTRVSQFLVSGSVGNAESKGTLRVMQNAACQGDITLATDLDRVSPRFNASDNTTEFYIDPATVTLHGTVTAYENVRVQGNARTSTFCPDPPTRPNTTNITLHLLLGFSNNTNESFPMPPCNHSVDVSRSFAAQDIYVNVSRYQYDAYGHPLFEQEWWEKDPNVTVSSIFEHTRTAGGLRVSKSTELSNGGQTSLYGSVRVIGIDTPCFSQPCLNDGTCHDEGHAAYFCDCKPLWTGQHCETPQQACYAAENDCAVGARCAHTGPCQAGDLWPGYAPRPGNPCPQEGDNFIIPTQFWKHECICPYGFDGTSKDRSHPDFQQAAQHTCTLSPQFKYYVATEPPGELQAIKLSANPATNDAFVKDHFNIRKAVSLRSEAQFGSLNIIKESVNSSQTDMNGAAGCVSQWDVRSLQRQLVCPNDGNPNGEKLISAEIFGVNQTYAGGGSYYKPLFLLAQSTVRAGALTCQDNVNYRQGMKVTGKLTCAKNYFHGNRSLTVSDKVIFGSTSGSKINIHGSVLAQCSGQTSSDCSGNSNPLVVSPSTGELAIEGSLRASKNSTMAIDVTLGRSSNNRLTLLGRLQLMDTLASKVDMVINATCQAEAQTRLASDMAVNGAAHFDVQGQSLIAYGYVVVQANAITTFSVQTWARKANSGTFTVMDSVQCDGFISTGALDASTLKIDSITGTVVGVGTTIEKSLIESGGFRLIQVDELSEMYVNMPLQGIGDGTGGIKVSRVVLGAGQAFLAIPPVTVQVDPQALCNAAASGACTYTPGSTPSCIATVKSTCEAVMNAADCTAITGCEYNSACTAIADAQCNAATGVATEATSKNMSVTLATLQNSGHMAVMDGSVTTLGFMQYYYDMNRLEPMARSAAINAGTESDWTEVGSTQNSFLTARTTFEGDLPERWRLRSNGDMDFGRGMLVCVASSGDTVARGDFTASASNDPKRFVVSSVGDRTSSTISSREKSSLELVARNKKIGMVVQTDRLHVRGSEASEELLQVTDASLGGSMLMLGDALLCDATSTQCGVSISSQEASTIRVISNANNRAVLEIKTGRDEIATFSLQDDLAGNNPSQMNMRLYGGTEYDTAPLLGITDKDNHHLLDMYDNGAYMQAELQGDVLFGGSTATESVSLTLFSSFSRTSMEIKSGPDDSSILSLVAAHKQSAALNLLNPSQTGAPRELTIKTRVESNNYMSLEIVDGECFTNPVLQPDGSTVNEQVCGRLLASVQPDLVKKDVTDLFVSGSGHFGSVDGTQNTYQSLLQSSDAAAHLSAESNSGRTSMIVNAGYLNESVLHLREHTPAAGQGSGSDIQVLYEVKREVEMLSQVNGNTTVLVEGGATLFPSFVVRNEQHNLLKLDVETTGSGVAGNLVLDGNSQFCEQNGAAVCTVTVQCKHNASLHVISINSTANMLVSPAGGQTASMNLVNRLNRVMRFANDNANSALHVERTEVRGLTPSGVSGLPINRTHFLSLENVNAKGKLTVPGMVKFGRFNSSFDCNVGVRSRLQATVKLISKSKDAVAQLASDTRCQVSLQNWDPTIGNTSTYAFVTRPLQQGQPTLRIDSTFNQLIIVEQNSTQHVMPYFSAVNTTYLTGPPLNTTAWEYRRASNMTDFNGSLHTSANVHIGANIVVGDATKPMDHQLTARSKQSADIAIASAGANASVAVHAGRDRTASVAFAVHELLVQPQTGFLTTPVRSTLSLAVRATTSGTESLPTLSLTDGVMNNLFSLYDVEKLLYGSSGYATVGGDFAIGNSGDSSNHRLEVQAARLATLELTAGTAYTSTFNIQAGMDLDQFIYVDSVPFINPSAPPHTRARLHLKTGLGPEAFLNSNGSMISMASGAQVNSRTALDIESHGRVLLRMYPKDAVSNDTSQVFGTHHLSLQGSASFGGAHPIDKNVTVKSSERAAMHLLAGASSTATMSVVSGPGKAAILTVQNNNAFKFLAEEVTQYGTGLLTLNNGAVDLLTLEEMSVARGGNLFGRSHRTTVTGTVTASVALEVTNDATLGDNALSDELSIEGSFRTPTLTFLPTASSSVAFVLSFANPTNLAVLTFPDTSSRPAGGGNVLTGLSTQSTLTEVATLSIGSIARGFGTITTDQPINTTCLVASQSSSCGQIITSGNMTAKSLAMTQQRTYLGSATVTTAIEPVGVFSADVNVASGYSVRVQSAINQKTTAIKGRFDPLSLASPIGDRDIALPDIYRDLSCNCNGMCVGNPPLYCGPGRALVLHRGEVRADEVGGAYVDATTGTIQSFITLLNPGALDFISMHNSQLTIDSIVVATISEFGQGGIVVVHAVTIMAQTNGVCVITVRNIGLSSMNGRYKLSFVIF